MYKMKKIVFLIIVVSFGFFSCKSNYVRIGDKNANYIPYYLKVYQADSLFLVGDYEKSYKILDSLFEKYEPINMEGYYEYGNYLSSSIMIGETKKLRRNVKLAYKNYGGLLIYHKDFFLMIEKISKETKLSPKKINTLKKKYFEKLDLDLRKKIESLIIEDQSVRGENNNSEKQFFFQKKHSEELENIFTNKGYPSYNFIGSDNYFDNTAEIDILLVHQDNKTIKKYLPFILENVINGKCKPSVYAFLYDRLIWNESNEKDGTFKQYYGSYVMSNGLPQLPIINQNKNDSIRKSIGLESPGYNKWRNEQLTLN